MRINHVTLVVLSGLLWLGIGVMLLVKGLHFVVHADTGCLVLKNLTAYLGNRDQAIVFLVALGLFAGLLKGRLVLLKAVKKAVNRIASLPMPVKVSQIYDKRYYILMAMMMGMGMMLNVLNIPEDVRGSVDIAIGSALMNGAMGFFRSAFTFKKEYL
ncbi:MAG: hypothetical protein V4494_04095 [Chlamydiota bacterium]